MPVFCKNCKKEISNQSGDLSGFSCSHCGGPLFRSKGIGRIGGAGLGAAIGAEFGGPIGAVVGGVLGFLLGNEADKNI